jgi:hypothetical protein
VAYVGDVKRWFADELGNALRREPELRGVIGLLPQSELVGELRSLGLGI